jgi:hypothetical protein
VADDLRRLLLAAVLAACTLAAVYLAVELAGGLGRRSGPLRAALPQLSHEMLRDLYDDLR